MGFELIIHRSRMIMEIASDGTLAGDTIWIGEIIKHRFWNQSVQEHWKSTKINIWINTKSPQGPSDPDKHSLKIQLVITVSRETKEQKAIQDNNEV